MNSAIEVTVPVRLDVGAPTDLDEFKKNSKFTGAIINFAITPRIKIRLIPRSDKKIVLHFSDNFSYEHFALNSKIDLEGDFALIKAAILHTKQKNGFEMFVETAAAGGSGLGMSGALGVATIAALYMHLKRNNKISPEIINEAVMLEKKYLNNVSGWQDQYASYYGGFNLLLFTKQGIKRRKLYISKKIQGVLAKHILVVNSGSSRKSGQVHLKTIEKYKKDKETVQNILINISNYTRQIENTLYTGNIQEFGKLIQEVWIQERLLGKSISTNHIKKIEKISKKFIVGMKTLGAGGGGYVLLVCKSPSNKKNLNKRLQEEFSVLNFEFSSEGLQVNTF